MVLDAEARRYPPIGDITENLGCRAAATTAPIPAYCRDGFTEA